MSRIGTHKRLLDIGYAPGTDGYTIGYDEGRLAWQLSSVGIPIGTIIHSVHHTNHAMNGATWLMCDGQEVSQTTYAELYALVGPNKFGTDADGNFFLPNVTERVISGEFIEGNIGVTGGSSDVTITTANMPNHTHTMAHTHPGAEHRHFIAQNSGTGNTVTNNHTMNQYSNHGNDNSAGLGTTNATADRLLSGTCRAELTPFAASTGTTGASSAANTGATGSGTSLDVRNKYINFGTFIRAL